MNLKVISINSEAYQGNRDGVWAMQRTEQRFVHRRDKDEEEKPNDEPIHIPSTKVSGEYFPVIGETVTDIAPILNKHSHPSDCLFMGKKGRIRFSIYSLRRTQRLLPITTTVSLCRSIKEAISVSDCASLFERLHLTQHPIPHLREQTMVHRITTRSKMMT